MKDEKTVTIQLTGKRLKANKVIAGFTIVVGLIIIISSSGSVPSPSGQVWGSLIALVGFGHLAVTRVRIWWNHK